MYLRFVNDVFMYYNNIQKRVFLKFWKNRSFLTKIFSEIIVFLYEFNSVSLLIDMLLVYKTLLSLVYRLYLNNFASTWATPHNSSKS